MHDYFFKQTFSDQEWINHFQIVTRVLPCRAINTKRAVSFIMISPHSCLATPPHITASIEIIVCSDHFGEVNNSVHDVYLIP